MDEPVIRPLNPVDAEALGEMLEACSEQTYRFFHPYPLTRDSAQRAANDPNVAAFAAELEGRILGYVWIDREPPLPWLGICVRDDAQNRGIGMRLMERAVEEARRLGKDGVQLTVMRENARAVALYERFGFVIDGEAADPFGPSHHMTLTFEASERG